MIAVYFRMNSIFCKVIVHELRTSTVEVNLGAKQSDQVSPCEEQCDIQYLQWSIISQLYNLDVLKLKDLKSYVKKLGLNIPTINNLRLKTTLKTLKFKLRISICFQIQFNSQHLNDYMFKVTEGKVEKVDPIFGKKFINRDGSVGTYVDGVISVPKNKSQVAQPSSPATISSKGYK